MRKRKSKRLLSGAAALMLTVMSIVPSGGLGVMHAQAATNVTSLKGNHTTTDVNLLVGDGENRDRGTTIVLRADTLEETIRNYDNNYAIGIASQFSVFLQENFTITESDAEGRVAVGGDIDIQTPYGSYAIGKGDFASKVPLHELLGESIDRLENGTGFAYVIIGGELKGGELSDCYYENGIVYGDDMFAEIPTHKSYKKLVINQTPPLPADYSLAKIPVESKDDLYQKIDQTQTYVTELLDFGKEFAKLKNVSVKFASTKPDGTYHYDDVTRTFTFTYTGSETEKENVFFTIADYDWADFEDALYVKFENIPTLPKDIYGEEGRTIVDVDFDSHKATEEHWAYSYIIVNVEGNGSKSLANIKKQNGQKFTTINKIPISREDTDSNDENWNNHRGTSSILYNFPDATEVVIGNNFQGTIFAPNADVTDWYTKDPEMTGRTDKRGHLSGALVAKSFEGATEFGYRPFSGPISYRGEYSVEVIKDDPEGTLISGATISIYGIDSEGREVNLGAEYTKISAEDAALVFDKLTPGKYVLREDNAPEHYAKSTEDIYFEIKRGDPITIPSIDTGEDIYAPVLYRLNAIRGQQNWHDAYIDAEERETFNWGSDVVSIACTENGMDLYIYQVIFQYRNGDVKAINITNINTVESGKADERIPVLYHMKDYYTEVYKHAGEDESGPTNPQPDKNDDIISVSLLMRYQPTSGNPKDTSAYPAFKLQKLGADGEWEDFWEDSEEHPYGTTRVYVNNGAPQYVTIYATEDVNLHYKKSTEQAPNGNNMPIQEAWMDEARWVEAHVSDLTVRFADNEGQLIVYADKDFTEEVATYTINPLDIENHVYVIDGNKYVFKNVKSETSFEVYKLGAGGELAAVASSGFKLHQDASGGYVVIKVTPKENPDDDYENNGYEVIYPTMAKPLGSFEIVNRKNIIINKYDKYSNLLNGAKFELIAETATADELANVTTADGTPIIFEENEDGKLSGVFTVNGSIELAGLPDGDYTLKEIEAPVGYEEAVELTFTIEKSKIKGQDENTIDITDDYTIDELVIKKIWDDNNNELGARPDSITVTITGTVDVDGVNAPTITRTVELKAPSWQSEVIKLTAADIADNWSELYEELPEYYYVYGDNGEVDKYKYTYTYEEDKVEAYEQVSVSEENGIVAILNGFSEFGSLTVTKEWVDFAGFKNPVHPDIIITLYGEDGKEIDTKILKNGELSVTFSDLPLYTYGKDADGKLTRTPIEYTVKESISDEVHGYKAEIATITKKLTENTTDTTASATVTFKNTYEKIGIKVNKVWVDNNDAAGVRPDHIEVTVNGTANGNNVYTTTITLDKEHMWEAELTNLPAYFYELVGDAVEEYPVIYTVEEPEVSVGYTSEVDGYTITNTFDSETTEITVNKVWVDNDDAAGMRPESIEVTVKGTANGKIVYTVTIILNEERNWTATIDNLVVNYYEEVEGEVTKFPIVYTVEESKVPAGYTSKVDGYTITNTFITRSVTINKVDIVNNNEVDGATLEVRDSKGNLVGKWVSETGETWTVAGLVPGEEYTLKETVTPDGYKTIENDIVFTVDENGKVTVISGVDGSVDEETGILLVNNTKITEGGSGSSNTGSSTVPILGISVMPVVFGGIIMSIGIILFACALWLFYRRKRA